MPAPESGVLRKLLLGNSVSKRRPGFIAPYFYAGLRSPHSDDTISTGCHRLSDKLSTLP
jgi:hypothetical protein